MEYLSFYLFIRDDDELVQES